MTAPRSIWQRMLEGVGGHGRPPGWQPSVRLILITVGVVALTLPSLVATAVETRGWAAGILTAGLILGMAASVLWPGERRPLARAHPYWDASVSIPIGLVAALILTSWPLWACIAGTAVYAGVIFAGAYRHQRRQATGPRTSA
jgi:hypothetical protein